MDLIAFIKGFFSGYLSQKASACPIAKSVIETAESFKTDLIILDAHNCTCSECAKYQGRVFSLSGTSKLFPRVPSAFFQYGAMHAGCTHHFSAYIHGISDPQLKHTLSVHKLNNSQYGNDIIAFSNRPFVDDRTELSKKESQEARAALSARVAQQKYYESRKPAFEAKLAAEEKDFNWLQKHLPDKCPASISGFRRMKTQNTKNYQHLQQLAAELGRKI